MVIPELSVLSSSCNTAYPFKRHSRFICGLDSGIFLHNTCSGRLPFPHRSGGDLVEFLLDGSNAARIPAGDDILDLLWKMQLLFLIDLVVLDDVDCDIVIDEAEDVEIQRFDWAFHLQDILLVHLAALRIFDDGNRAVKLVELQIVVDLQAHAGFDMV